ncbi:MAG: DUF3473 domain-containing protein [Planctomycetes bacterium]|nr:DUF3473 domain-containing protein [Planctomycetota bacterium]
MSRLSSSPFAASLAAARADTLPSTGALRLLNALSVDVEDYYQVLNFARGLPRSEWARQESRVVPNTRRLLALFAEHQVHATFFVLGCVAAQHPELVREIAAAGHEVGSHGMSHAVITSMTRAEFRAEARESKALLEDLSGQPVHGFRAPSFSIMEKTLWALDELLDAGYTYDSSIFPVRHPDYGMPSVGDVAHTIRSNGSHSLVELPMSVARCCGVAIPVSGGGYFRLLPWWLTRWGLNRIQKQRPFVFYLHPWETDQEQPNLRRFTSRAGAFRHYVGLKHTMPRLECLLREFKLGTIRDTLRAAGYPLNTQ